MTAPGKPRTIALLRGKRVLMATRYDILDARTDLENHQDSHHCGLGQHCPARTAAWDRYMNTAARWGIEPGDDARQREQFHARHPQAIS